MKTLGSTLKEAREKLGLSISEVSLATKISTKILNGLENGERESLPANSFLRGFVRTYAAYLKLNTEEVLNLFQQEHSPAAVPSTIKQTPLPKTENPERVSTSNVSHRADPDILRPSNKKTIFSAIGIVVLLVLIVSVQKIYEKYAHESRVAELPKDLPKIEPAPAQEQPPEPPVAISEPTTVAVNVAAPVEPPTQPTVSLAVAKPAPEVKPPAPTVTTAQSTPETKVVATPTPAPAPTPSPAQSTAPKEEESVAAVNEIIIEALDKVDLSFKINNGPTEKLSLSADQVHTIKLRGKLALDISDGGAVNIIQNGRDRGVPGDLGKPKKVYLP